MKPTQILNEEHELILAMLDIIGVVCNRLEHKARVDREHLEQIIDFIRTFADGCHHLKEENVLFPVLEKAGIQREGGPIGVMLHEHETGRGLVKKMDDALGRIKTGDPAAGRSFAEHARQYIQLLTGHINKENSVLFPMADRELLADEQERIASEFDRIEREEIGQGVHEKYHAMIHRLRDVFIQI